MSWGPPPRRKGDDAALDGTRKGSSTRKGKPKSRGASRQGKRLGGNFGGDSDDDDDLLSVVGTGHAGVLQHRKYKPVKFTPSYVDESLFGEPASRKTKGFRSTDDEPPPWDPAAKKMPRGQRPSSATTAMTAQQGKDPGKRISSDSGRMGWTKPSFEGKHRPLDPRKLQKTDPWGGPVTNTAPPSRGAKKPMTSDIWAGKGRPLSLKKPVEGARKQSTIKFV